MPRMALVVDAGAKRIPPVQALYVSALLTDAGAHVVWAGAIALG